MKLKIIKCCQADCQNVPTVQILYYDSFDKHFATREWCCEHENAASGATRKVIRPINKKIA